MLPSFETERLLIRPRSMADFDACLAMDRDPDVTQYIVGPWDDPVAHQAFLTDRIQRSFGDGLGYWSIFPRAEPNQFLGWILLIPYDGIGPEIEIGWRLNRLAWGKGFATEAARPFVRHAFELLKLPRIVADINPANASSIRVARKIGMRFVGDIEHDGALLKSYLMTAEDFKSAAPIDR
ncbi:GNAT family N-acetyltransferase [Bosea sp. SSUT16]|jgi:RimJ/RimL family protein N-acetyltransferase|uniref:GNAT family N-acetyltransferase n=1 Tax=Bosea spartocytisi TaxID=2773451 RepID=A0A927I366_9HYPH|nr:GNAT family N-acetyltransferase [Bosea spartocytisi]MBD3849477.1 GNAT family N-acetyltransferase [Bosea spartocytisi]MCT4471546.1 GNAT family N-acetyltransferase [Bosea spartocytisi]